MAEQPGGPAPQQRPQGMIRLTIQGNEITAGPAMAPVHPWRDRLRAAEAPGALAAIGVVTAITLSAVALVVGIVAAG